ncbi:hypothetical protein EDB85DRAFT_2033310, partial [Lactarius pseudohatsudake]
MVATSTLRLVTEFDLTLWTSRMEINSLLSPAGESHIMTEATDTDIYQVVLGAIEACENMEKNGGDNVDEDG